MGGDEIEGLFEFVGMISNADTACGISSYPWKNTLVVYSMLCRDLIYTLISRSKTPAVFAAV